MAAKSSTAALALALVACASPSGDQKLHPLVDDRHYPDVLTESRVIELPPSLNGNRFLRGWFPWQHRGTPVWVPHTGSALFEVVNLSGRRRSLAVAVRLLGEQGDFTVGVRAAERSLGEVPLTPSLQITLPQNLPLGRVPIELTFPKAPDPVVVEAGLSAAMPPGKVEISPDRLVQGPSSLVDFVRRLVPGTRLVGHFEPPVRPREDQRFAIVVERESDTPEILFDWGGSWLDRLRGRRSLSIPLQGEQGFVRIRLLAEGSGPPATWRGLGLELAARPSPPVATELPDPPRLIVLYVLDALRADHVDLAPGADSITPTLARLASEGVTFERHLSVAPNTIPSTKSLFTGQAFVLRGHSRLAEDGAETLAEIIWKAGYRTAAFSGNGYISETYGTSRGFEYLADEVVFQDYEDEGGAYNDNAERVHRSALAWLHGLGKGERAFIYLHTIHPHNPYDPPDRLQERFTRGLASHIKASTRTLLDIKHNRLDITESDQDRIRGLYAGAVAYNDAQLALLVEELERQFPAGEKLLIVTSDHGEELFDHGGVLHGYTLYNEQLHIPLILHWPGHLRPHRVQAATDNLDLHESLRALVGARPSTIADGTPFWSLALQGGSSTAAPELRFAAASSVQGGVFMAQSSRYKLVFAPRVGQTFGMGEGRGRSRDAEYLFDLGLDPGESVNRAGELSLEPAWLRSRLTAWIERGKYLEREDEEPNLDDETRARLRALGYLE